MLSKRLSLYNELIILILACLTEPQSALLEGRLAQIDRASLRSNLVLFIFS